MLTLMCPAEMKNEPDLVNVENLCPITELDISVHQHPFIYSGSGSLIQSILFHPISSSLSFSLSLFLLQPVSINLKLCLIIVSLH